jgi:tripeptide aminopeptidase
MEVERDFPGARVEVEIAPQYRNLASGLAREPRAVAFVEEAFRRLGLPCERSLIRGGTDGAHLTSRGLPTPNLSSGQHNPHSTLEWACLEEMQEGVEVVLTTLRVWAESC